MRRYTSILALSFLAMSTAFLAISEAQPPFQGKGKGKGGMDASHKADMELFHYLLDHRKDIVRTITKRDDGVESVTESNDPMVAEKFQAHVISMKKRVEEKRPIHLRDPLFAAIFQNADKISFQWERTPKGAKVVETSKDPSVARLLQAHAEVVSLFLKNGHAEVMKNHDLPKP
jgi:hypothetical protein